MTILKNVRSEQEIFNDLKILCISPGYIYAIADLCFKSHFIQYSAEMKEADVQAMYINSSERLIRNEINILLGLLVNADINWGKPTDQILNEYIDITIQLLEELHNAMKLDALFTLDMSVLSSGSLGNIYREAIFYSGESAYDFQFLDCAISKYRDDEKWMKENYQFNIDEAVSIAKAIQQLQSDTKCFIVTVADVAKKACLTEDLTELVMNAFTLNDNNHDFNTLHDFNKVCEKPLLRLPSRQFISLQPYALAEAIYSSPFYWVQEDRNYKETAAKNRGKFTEEFAAKCLRQVFGKGCVYENVIIKNSKAIAGEIDVLLIWKNRIIIVQCKSKKLKMESRKGNDLAIREDFKIAIQDSYNQGVKCAKYIKNHKEFALTDKNSFSLPDDIKEIYIFCVVSENYPALNFQSHAFLKITNDIHFIRKPLIIDVFALDVITEMLNCPLYFFSYVDLRTSDLEYISNNELSILAFHLKYNLWHVVNKADLIHIDDSLSASLDLAMFARRTGVNGTKTPNGILSYFKKTALGHIIEQLKIWPCLNASELCLLLLKLKEDSVISLSDQIERRSSSLKDNGNIERYNGLSVRIFESGFTMQFGNNINLSIKNKLMVQCSLRKYKEKTNQWFGLCIKPETLMPLFIIQICKPWQTNINMDNATREMKNCPSL